jgi:hypothetical protein
LVVDLLGASLEHRLLLFPAADDDAAADDDDWRLAEPVVGTGCGG